MTDIDKQIMIDLSNQSVAGFLAIMASFDKSKLSFTKKCLFDTIEFLHQNKNKDRDAVIVACILFQIGILLSHDLGPECLAMITGFKANEIGDGLEKIK